MGHVREELDAMTAELEQADTGREADHRREGARYAAIAAEKDRTRLRQAQEALSAHDAQMAEHRRGAADARRSLTAHRTALRALADDRARVRAEVKKASKAAEKSAARAGRAEQKYERGVLADLVRRETAADRRAHPADADGNGARHTVGADALASVTRKPTPRGERVTAGSQG
jgi:hypothetical protein